MRRSRTESGKTADALRLTDALISEKPRSPDGHILKARLLLASHGDLGRGRRQAQAAVHADTGSTAAHYTAGLVAITRKDFEGAERAFLESAKLNPRAAAPQLQLARLRLARGDSAGALNAAEEAAAARPDDVEAAVLMVRSLRAQGAARSRTPRAGTTGLKASPDDPRLLIESGWVELSRIVPTMRGVSSTRPESRAGLRSEARVGAVASDVALRDSRQGAARVDGWLAKQPHDPSAQMLGRARSICSRRSRTPPNGGSSVSSGAARRGSTPTSCSGNLSQARSASTRRSTETGRWPATRRRPQAHRP